MYGSKSDYFLQEEEKLKTLRKKISLYLYLKGYNNAKQKIYVKAFDFFCRNPEKFDGATIAKDLHDLPHLDMDAMAHDHQYVVYNVASGFKTKWRSDYAFLKGMESRGKGVRVGRFIWLTISGLFYVPMTRIKRGKMTAEQKEAFNKEMAIMMI